MNKVKIALVVAVAALSGASAVYAQSLNPSYGTGNVLPFTYGQPAPQERKVVVHQNGLHAFASAPRSPSTSSNDPENTGGGSRGYNENLYNY